MTRRGSWRLLLLFVLAVPSLLLGLVLVTGGQAAWAEEKKNDRAVRLLKVRLTQLITFASR